MVHHGFVLETKHYFPEFLRPLNLVINLGTTMQKR